MKSFLSLEKKSKYVVIRVFLSLISIYSMYITMLNKLKAMLYLRGFKSLYDCFVSTINWMVVKKLFVNFESILKCSFT